MPVYTVIMQITSLFLVPPSPRMRRYIFTKLTSLSIVPHSTALISQSFFRASVRLARLTTPSLQVDQSARGFNPTQSIFNSSQTVIYSCFGKLTHLNYSFINWGLVMANFSPNKSFKGTAQSVAFAPQTVRHAFGFPRNKLRYACCSAVP